MSISLSRLNILWVNFGSVGVPEVVIYGDDEGLPPQLRTSQVELFGSPHYVDFAGAGETVYASGWIDVAGNNKIKIKMSTTGEAGATGNVVAKFLVGNNLVDVLFDTVEASFNITLASNGANEVSSISEFSIGAWRYMRLYSITNGSGKTARICIRILSPVQPVIITKI